MSLSLGFICLAAFGLFLREIKVIRKSKVQLARENAWPQFQETYISALQSGISIPDAFSFVKDFELPEFAELVSDLVADLDCGSSFHNAVEKFRDRVALGSADLFIAIVSLAHKSGSQNLVQALSDHSTAVRFELAADGDIRARQNAILSVAKLGLLAPWILVAVLSVNEQTRNAFNSWLGSLLLIGGFAVSLLAYRLVVAAGLRLQFRRIFGGLHG